MRLTVRHHSTYRFVDPAGAIVQTLRMSPRSHDGQHVSNWRVDVDRNCRLRSREDAFGNLTHVFAVDGPIEELTVLVEGEVDTQDTTGVVNGAAERFPPALFLRETPLTAPDPDINAFADEIGARSTNRLETLHALLDDLHETMTFEPHLADSAPAAEAFRLKTGVCQDITHVFLVAARRMGIPARFVSGYLRQDEELKSAPSGHAWAEAHVAELGWVGFDPSNGMCPTDAYIRVAIGLDYLGAAPVRGSRYGGAGETLDAAVVVQDALAQPFRRRF